MSSSDDSEAATLWKVNRTIQELVKDRGYQVADDEIHMDLSTFESHYANSAGSVDRNQLNFFTNLRVNPQIFKDIRSGVIIFPGIMTPSARKVEEFAEADLLVYITHHKLVPRHDVLTPEEKKMVLERYHLKETQLPRIQPADPIARYYGLRRGQVVKITRPSETSGRYASYRICF
ncbi:DNA-directed RNA polymerase RPB5 subunit [Stereum hirsutum FP-91666 SS1]|uniref:DNA-directed RNA polymerase RPB5 subunit n=1 Tax=Stereum hirsutum (strain FP-91666) TaxID=721885 RepID=UPI000440DE1E|nr:DNA-directed RNA polymerase RPB5 subunit [Stereum hirsutum FP-91666 SS1]EIM91000.1 DNA-directed RNA polymerase RPB5 subunit [Stereum hirsutum FP-91666 SS1]